MLHGSNEGGAHGQSAPVRTAQGGCLGHPGQVWVWSPLFHEAPYTSLQAPSSSGDGLQIGVRRVVQLRRTPEAEAVTQIGCRYNSGGSHYHCLVGRKTAQRTGIGKSMRLRNDATAKNTAQQSSKRENTGFGRDRTVGADAVMRTPVYICSHISSGPRV
jgi:hypothetical protein